MVKSLQFLNYHHHYDHQLHLYLSLLVDVLQAEVAKLGDRAGSGTTNTGTSPTRPTFTDDQQLMMQGFRIPSTPNSSTSLHHQMSGQTLDEEDVGEGYDFE